MSTSQTRPGICSEPFCGRPLHGWGAFCGHHAANMYRYGHASLRSGILESDLKPFAKWVREGLARYRNTKGTANVLKLVDDILNYNAGGSCVRAERDLTRVMAIMRDHQVAAEDVLFRVCTFQAYSAANLARFRGSQRAENTALGLIVLRLIPLQKTGARWASKTVLLLAEQLRTMVVPYADRLLQLIKDESARKHELVLASLDLTTAEDVPADPTPRAGRSYRKRRGVQQP